MKLNSFALAAAVVVLLFGGISFSSAMNWWQTESSKVPAMYAEGEAAGEYNPADIRGSYTFGEISELFDISMPDLQAAFRIPADIDPEGYQVKSLEEQFIDLPVEVGTGSVRMFAAFYQGLPYELSMDEETYLFPEAAVILQARGAMRPEQSAYLEGHIVPEGPTASSPAATQAVDAETAVTPAPTEHAAPEYQLTGKTTFQNLLDWGVTQEAIEAVLGESMPSSSTVIKDYASQKGLEFSGMKANFQAEVDKVK